MASIFKRKGRGPWIIKWFDAQGRRRERSSRTTDRRAAGRIAAQIDAAVALRRDGVVDPRQDRLAAEDAKTLQSHIDAYLAHLRLAQRSPRTIADAKAHLSWVTEALRASRLSDLTLVRVERALSVLQKEGKSARTINHRGGSVRAFLSWAVNAGRIASNPLRSLPTQAEELDRRRERRALSGDEVASLLRVAEERGRKLWYMLALLAGLRLSELKRLRWGDIDLDRGALTVRYGKAKRVDEVPLLPALRDELLSQRPSDALPSAPVFPTAPTNETRTKDYRRAKIALVDEHGFHADLHSLRVTLGTMLARDGVPPQVAQRIMRHSRYSTTLRFYTPLTLADTAAAMSALEGAVARAMDPHHRPHHSEDDRARSSAS